MVHKKKCLREFFFEKSKLDAIIKIESDYHSKYSSNDI